MPLVSLFSPGLSTFGKSSLNHLALNEFGMYTDTTILIRLGGGAIMLREVMSNMPIILRTVLVSNLYFISQMLYNKAHSSIFAKILGQWEAISASVATVIPTSGLTYYVSPPATLSTMFCYPFNAIFYFIFTLNARAILANFFSNLWLKQ